MLCRLLNWSSCWAVRQCCIEFRPIRRCLSLLLLYFLLLLCRVVVTLVVMMAEVLLMITQFKMHSTVGRSTVSFLFFSLLKSHYRLFASRSISLWQSSPTFWVCSDLSTIFALSNFTLLILSVRPVPTCAAAITITFTFAAEFLLLCVTADLLLGHVFHHFSYPRQSIWFLSSVFFCSQRQSAVFLFVSFWSSSLVQHPLSLRAAIFLFCYRLPVSQIPSFLILFRICSSVAANFF